MNEAPTAIDITATTVDENAANGAVVGVLSAADADAGSTHTFALVAPHGDAGGRFSISGNQLRVANGSLLNHEAATSHTVTVRSTDGGGQAFERDIAITVNDVNEAPTNILLSSAAIDENSADATLIGLFTGQDPDVAASFTYAFQGPGGNAGGRFAIVGDELQVADGTLLDHEAATSHTVTVRITDNGAPGLTHDRSFTIVVNNVNEAPTGINLSSLLIDENVPDGTLLGVLSGADPDIGDSLSFAFVAPDYGAGGRFRIEGNQVIVNNGSLLNYEGSSSYQVTLRASDAAGLGHDRNFAVTLNNVNDPPTVSLTGSPGAPALTTTLLVAGRPVALAQGAAFVDDEDTPLLAGMRIRLDPCPDGAEESLSFQPVGAIQSDGYNPVTGVLTLSGSDTPAHYSAALRSVVYRNQHVAPTLTPRTITFVADDGIDAGGQAVASLALRPSLEARTEDNQAFPGDGSRTVTLGPVVLHHEPAFCDMTLANAGSAMLTLASLNLPAGFDSPDMLPGSLAPGTEAIVRIRMAANEVGRPAGQASLTSNDPLVNPWLFMLSGSVTEPRNSATDWAWYE